MFGFALVSATRFKAFRTVLFCNFPFVYYLPTNVIEQICNPFSTVLLVTGQQKKTLLALGRGNLRPTKEGYYTPERVVQVFV